jgi:hypothetical protein
MMIVPAGVKVHPALGYTDMRKGLDDLATLVQEHLKKVRSRATYLLFAARMRQTEGPVLGRQRTLLVYQEARSRRLHLAEDERFWRRCDGLSSAARDAD